MERGLKNCAAIDVDFTGLVISRRHYLQRAHTILEALMRAPGVVEKNLLENIAALSVFLVFL